MERSFENWILIGNIYLLQRRDISSLQDEISLLQEDDISS